jgi:hypothetical protein
MASPGGFIDQVTRMWNLDQDEPIIGSERKMSP